MCFFFREGRIFLTLPGSIQKVATSGFCYPYVVVCVFQQGAHCKPWQKSTEVNCSKTIVLEVILQFTIVKV